MWHPLAPARRPAPSRRRALRPRPELLEGRALLAVVFDSVLTVGNDTASLIPADSAVDAAGSTYVTGMLSGTMDFDPANVRADGADVLTPRGTTDAYVVKYNADNSFAWARLLGSDYVRQSDFDTPEQGNGVRVDGAGNVYVAGTFFGQADFGPFRLTSAGDADAFVAKLDRDGNVLWARSWGTADRDVATDLAVDAAGNVIAVGTSAFADSVQGWIANTSQVRKFGPTGTPVWNQTFAGPTCEAFGVTTDAASNIYVCGKFSGTIDFNADRKRVNSASGNYGSGYVLKLSAAGAYGWVSAFQTRTTPKSYGSALTMTDIAVDGAGSVVVSGQFQGEIDFNPSGTIDTRLVDARRVNGFVTKLNANGSLAWARATGGDHTKAVAIDGAGAIYVTGSFYYNGTFTPGSGLPDVATRGGSDVYVSKFTASGNLAWAQTFGGAGADLCYGIAVDAAGTISLAGYSTSATIDYDPDPATTQERTNAAYADLFLLRLRQS